MACSWSVVLIRLLDILTLSFTSCTSVRCQSLGAAIVQVVRGTFEGEVQVSSFERRCSVGETRRSLVERVDHGRKPRRNVTEILCYPGERG